MLQTRKVIEQVVNRNRVPTKFIPIVLEAVSPIKTEEIKIEIVEETKSSESVEDIVIETDLKTEETIEKPILNDDDRTNNQRYQKHKKR